MTDVIDQAAKLEQLQRDQALRNALRKPTEPQEIDNFGNYYCNDCGVVIPPARILAVPTACCCIDSQSIREQKGKHSV